MPDRSIFSFAARGASRTPAAPYSASSASTASAANMLDDGPALVPPLQHPILTMLFVIAATFDITLTWIILSLGGIEVNPIADSVISYWGLNGAIVFKYALTVFVIVIAEVVTRLEFKSGRRLALAAVIISSIPVVWSTFLLLGGAFAG